MKVRGFWRETKGTHIWTMVLRYLEAYLEIVQDPELGSVIAAQLFGHVHKDHWFWYSELRTKLGGAYLAARFAKLCGDRHLGHDLQLAQLTQVGYIPGYPLPNLAEHPSSQSDRVK